MQLLVEKHTLKRVGKFLLIMLYNYSRFVTHERRYPALIGYNHRRPRSDGFRHGVAKILVLRWQYKNMRITVRAPLPIAEKRAGKLHACIDVQFSRQLFQA